MDKPSNSIWKLTEEDEKENDYKRLQKKFSFINKNKPSFNNTKSTNGQSFNKSKKDATIDFSTSNIIKSMTKDFCETSQSFKIEEFLGTAPYTKYENLENINITEPKMDQKKSESSNYDMTERNNKNTQFINNNSVVFDAMRKISNTSSVDSIRDYDPANKSNQININLNKVLPSNTFMIEDSKTSSIRDYDKSIYRRKANEIDKEEESKRVSSSSSEGVNSIHHTLNKHKITNNIFFYNPEYNLSTRLLNDEKERNKFIPPNSEVKLLKEIREKKNNKTIDPKNFLKMSENSFFNILTMCFDNYESLIASCKVLAFKTHVTLFNKFSGLIDQFRDKYKDELELQEYYFISEKQRQKYKHNSSFNLVLKSKIISPIINKTIEVSLKYKLQSICTDYFQYTWMYDKRNKNDIGYWIASEAEQYENNIIRYSYIQPLMSFTMNDLIEIQINIFSKDSIIYPENIEWEDLRIENCPLKSFLDYEKTLRKLNLKFDKLRYCEFENLIHVWKGEQSLTKKKSLDEFKKIFSKNFYIKSITYDIAKFYIFKVKMNATEKGKRNILSGLIRKNKFMNFEMEIVDSNNNVCHEIKSLGVQNHHMKKFDIRLGSWIIVYFTDIYL